MSRARLVVVWTILAAGCARAPSAKPASPSSVAFPRGSSLSPDNQPGFAVPIGAEQAERHQCIDRELADRNLNDYGDPEGTTYPGGAPLLGVSGAAGDRYQCVLQRHPEIGVSCSRALGEPGR